MYQHLYAIADRLPAAWRPPETSVGGPVVLRRLGDLVVVACDVDPPPLANARTLALHHDVVATTLDAVATVPFRFGTVVADRGPRRVARRPRAPRSRERSASFGAASR